MRQDALTWKPGTPVPGLWTPSEDIAQALLQGWDDAHALGLAHASLADAVGDDSVLVGVDQVDEGAPEVLDCSSGRSHWKTLFSRRMP